MKLIKLELTNFRNYSSISVNFDSDLVLILGDNASGKTNFLESVYYLSTLKSFRGPEILLTKQGQDYFRIKGTSSDDVYEVSVQTAPVLRKNLRINEAKVSKPFWKSFATVLFIPPDLNLFTLGPSLRRRFFDETLAQIKKDYALNLILLDHVLKQRASLLEKVFKQQAALDELLVWDEQLADLAINLGEARNQLTDFMQPAFAQTYRSLTDFPNEFQIVYKGTTKTKEEFVAHLLSLREAEVSSGQNLFGPHREDFVLMKDGQLNIYNSSRGELRAQVLALKLLQASYLNQSGRQPIILLDDVFSELDETRRAKLIEGLHGHQIFITTTEEHHLPKMKRHAQTLKVKENIISE